MPEVPEVETIRTILEPLSPELAGSYLRERLGRRSKPVKEALLDQTVVAGIGNIYADEILWEARVRPDRTCSGLSTRAWNKIAAATRTVIQWGISTDRMTPEDYLTGAGREYRNIPDLGVYGRQGEPCRRCGTIIKRVIIGGRGSCYCTRCQRKG
jgi:formamidopyrimidine-DNA glycosylase